MTDWGVENNSGNRYVLVVIESFSKFVWTVPLKNKNTQTIKESFEKILVSSKRKPNLIETGRGKEFYINLFENFSNKNNFKICSRNTSLGAVFAKRFNHTIRDRPKKPVFEKGDGNWIGVLPTITKQYKNRVHSSNKLTPIDGSLKKNEGYVYQKFIERKKPNNTNHDFVWVADLKKTFWKRDTTNWSYKLYELSENFNDTIPSYHIDS